MKLSTMLVALVFGASLLSSGCSRKAIAAVNLANEASQLRKQGAYDAAIDKYEAAAQLDPHNHEILYMLATTYRHQEEWEKVASTLARATEIAPKYANYWYERGYALVRIASKAKLKSAWEEAREPLQKCIQTDPNYAQCYFQLGTVDLYLDKEQLALENYTKAIQHAPDHLTFYARLADLYIRLDYLKQAKSVLEEGIRFSKLIKPKTMRKISQDPVKARFNLYMLLSQVLQFQHDLPGMVKALETANKIGGKTNPEILFNLGSTYAILNPPKKTQAIQMLKNFQARACKGAKAQKYKEQCQQSMALIAKLGGV